MPEVVDSLPDDAASLDIRAQTVRNVPSTEPNADVARVRRCLEKAHFDAIDDVAVCEAGRLIGLVPLEAVLTAADDVIVSAIMDPDPPMVTANDELEPAIWKAVRHKESSVALVDDTGMLQGLVPARHLLRVLLAEHDEDLARLGGYLASTSTARSAAEEPVARRLLHRLPWLFIGLAGALLAAGIVAGFDSQLSANLTVAFFVPGIVYLADAVGTQTETVVIRGLSVGVPMRHVVAREVMTGLLVGLFLAAAFLPMGLLLWHDSDVVVATALALFAATSSATLVAMGLPWLLDRAGRDPAFGSGPIATVIQDLGSLVIYFLVVAAIVD